MVGRSSADLPEAPDAVTIIGCDGANGTYHQLYSDDRGVCRIYEMSIGDGEGSSGVTASRSRSWEIAEDGENYETDFDLTYRKVS